jgi:hypothetical protein
MNAWYIEWCSSAWVEPENVRAALDAYGRGEIRLPPIPKNTPKKEIRDLCESSRILHYMKASVTEFLGLTSDYTCMFRFIG